jgi:hypothetical protein
VAAAADVLQARPAGELGRSRRSQMTTVQEAISNG